MIKQDERILEKGFIGMGLVAVYLFNVGNFWNAYWYGRWYVFLSLFSLVIAWVIAKRTTMQFFGVFAVFLLSAAWLAAWNLNGYLEEFGLLKFLALSKAGFYSYITVLMTGLFLAFIPKRLLLTLKWSLILILLLAITLTVNQSFTEIPYKRVGFAGNASMNGSIIAAMLPLLLGAKPLGKFRIPLFLLGCFSVYTTDASVPLGVFIVAILAYMGHLYWNKLPKMALIGGFLVSILGAYYIGVSYMGDQLFHTQGRIDIWRLAMAWWWDHSDIFVGAGQGSAISIVPDLQIAQGDRGNFFMWLHNDWLQTVFETGIIGLVALLYAWWEVVKKSLRSPALFASVMGFSAMACFNYPARLVQSWFICVVLVWVILRDKRESDFIKNSVDQNAS